MHCCDVFTHPRLIIEGDFGGALKVDQYINGGDGIGKEVVAEIGFSIYHTQEMADMVD